MTVPIKTLVKRVEHGGLGDIGGGGVSRGSKEGSENKTKAPSDRMKAPWLLETIFMAKTNDGKSLIRLSHFVSTTTTDDHHHTHHTHRGIKRALSANFTGSDKQ